MGPAGLGLGLPGPQAPQARLPGGASHSLFFLSAPVRHRCRYMWGHDPFDVRPAGLGLGLPGS